MMTEQLRYVFEQIERLPEDAQNQLAAVIHDELEKQEWQAIVSTPRVQHALRRMATEALRQDTSGETEDGGWDIE